MRWVVPRKLRVAVRGATGQHDSFCHVLSHCPADQAERDLRPGLEFDLLRHARPAPPLAVPRPLARAAPAASRPAGSPRPWQCSGSPPPGSCPACLAGRSPAAPRPPSAGFPSPVLVSPTSQATVGPADGLRAVYGGTLHQARPRRSRALGPPDAAAAAGRLHAAGSQRSPPPHAQRVVFEGAPLTLRDICMDENRGALRRVPCSEQRRRKPPKVSGPLAPRPGGDFRGGGTPARDRPEADACSGTAD